MSAALRGKNDYQLLLIKLWLCATVLRLAWAKRPIKKSS